MWLAVLVLSTCFTSIALNIICRPLDIIVSIRVYVRRNRSVVSIFTHCVCACRCWFSLVLILWCVLLTVRLLFRILRKLNGKAGLLTLLSTLWKNVLRLRLSILSNVRVMQA